MVRELREYARDVERSWAVEGFAVPVGVSTGPVVLGHIGAGRRIEYAAFGDTVNTAARLQSAAPPNTVLVGDATHRLVEPAFEWGDRFDVEAKGKVDRVVAFDARSARDGGTKRRGLPGTAAPLVGRDRELAMARAALEAVFDGSGGILFVVLVAPAPYFMNVVNRPDAGPQPRHAIERDGAPAWSEPERQVVSGPFRQLERRDGRVVLVRTEAYSGTRPGTWRASSMSVRRWTMRSLGTTAERSTSSAWSIRRGWPTTCRGTAPTWSWAPRRGRPTSPSTTAIPSRRTPTSGGPSRTPSTATRSTGSSPPITCWRRAGSSHRRCTGTRPTSRCGWNRTGPVTPWRARPGGGASARRAGRRGAGLLGIRPGGDGPDVA